MSGNGTSAYATTIPFTFFAKWHASAGATASRLLPAAAQAPKRPLAATPGSRTSTQVPKRALNIWRIDH